jgi:hypothetical protein
MGSMRLLNYLFILTFWRGFVGDGQAWAADAPNPHGKNYVLIWQSLAFIFVNSCKILLCKILYLLFWSQERSSVANL